MHNSELKLYLNFENELHTSVFVYLRQILYENEDQALLNLLVFLDFFLVELSKCARLLKTAYNFVDNVNIIGYRSTSQFYRICWCQENI